MEAHKTPGNKAGQQINGGAEIKPKRIASCQVRCEKNSNGDKLYILHNPDANTYLEIDPLNYYLWGLMDGERNIVDLAMAFDKEYGAFPFDRLVDLIEQLRVNSLLEGVAQVVAPEEANTFTIRLKRLSDTALQREYDWQGVDGAFTWFYHRIGRIFFTLPALIVLAVISIIGLICFVVKEQTKTFELLSVNGSYGVGLLILFIANWVVLFWHESGHGLACKHFGRIIRKAGMMFYNGMPAFFVDVNDMWMTERVPHILVLLAGPAVNVIIGSDLSIVVVLHSPTIWTQALFQVAFIANIGALLNLNP